MVGHTGALEIGVERVANKRIWVGVDGDRREVRSHCGDRMFLVPKKGDYWVREKMLACDVGRCQDRAGYMCDQVIPFSRSMACEGEILVILIHV